MERSGSCRLELKNRGGVCSVTLFLARILSSSQAAPRGHGQVPWSTTHGPWGAFAHMEMMKILLRPAGGLYFRQLCVMSGVAMELGVACPRMAMPAKAEN